MSNPFEGGHNAIPQQKYEPSLEQQERLNALKNLVTALETAKVQYAIFGGYGLDGLYGQLTRDHHDIDLVIGTGSEEKARSILASQGIYRTRVKKSNAEVYMHPPTQTEVDVADWTLVATVVQADAELFFPQEPNAFLDGVSFRAATLQGQEISHEVQKKRAQEGEWGEYEHEKQRRELVEKIRNRN